MRTDFAWGVLLACALTGLDKDVNWDLKGVIDPVESDVDELQLLLKLQADRIRVGKSVLVRVAEKRIRQCPRHGLHNAWFHTKADGVVCLWCERDLYHDGVRDCGEGSSSGGASDRLQGRVCGRMKVGQSD